MFFDNLIKSRSASRRNKGDAALFIQEIFAPLCLKEINRRTNEYWLDDEEEIERTLVYEYDASGNLLSVTDPSAIYEYEYDSLNRLIGNTQTIDGLDEVIHFDREYDAASRMTESAATIGGTADYINNYSHDRLGRVLNITQSEQDEGNAVGAKRAEFQYNAAGQMTYLGRYASTTYDNGVAESGYSYDLAGRLTSIGHYGLGPESNISAEYAYHYDPANRLVLSTINYVDSEFAYDATGQLTDVDVDGSLYLPDQAYDYDANGNRLALNSAIYTIGDNNRLLSDGTYSYEYDNEGNLTRRTNGDGDYLQYSWDHRNRLTQVAWYLDNDTLLGYVTYVYDAFNQLIVEDSSATTTFSEWGRSDPDTFIYDGGQIVLRFADDELTHRYLWGAEVDQLLADEKVEDLVAAVGNETLWALTDLQGSIRELVDANGIVRKRVDFDAFGNNAHEEYYDEEGELIVGMEPWAQDEAVEQLFYFTGRMHDKVTGLQNNLNRWYDSATGRWISEDPIGFAAGDANLYRYVGNTPTMLTDPSGLSWSWPSFSDYLYYLTHPGEQDSDIQTAQAIAVATSAVCLAGAAGLAAGGAAGITQVGTVPISQVPQQVVIEYWTWGFPAAAAANNGTSTRTCPNYANTSTIWPPPNTPTVGGPFQGGNGYNTPFPYITPIHRPPYPLVPGNN